MRKRMFWLCFVTAMVLFGLPTQAQASITDKFLGRCSWSFFGDPRSIVYKDTVFTGCIGEDNVAYVTRLNLETGAYDRLGLMRFSWMDDHNNPSLVMWRGRLCAFFSPHSGHVYPKDRKMFMAYRCSLERYGLHGGFGPVRYVPLERGCGLGYTYANPVKAGNRLYLFMRGPCWQPYFTWSSDKDLTDWAEPQTLVMGPHSPTNKQRPYAKYVGGHDGSIHAIFSDGHITSFTSSMRYVRIKGSRFYRADGTEIASDYDPTLRTDQLDTVYAYSPEGGRAWPMDVSVGRDDNPAVLYTRYVHGAGDTYWYARWDGQQWLNYPIVHAGRDYGGYHNGGASLLHGNPSYVTLSRNGGTSPGSNEVDIWHTPDGGTTWQTTPVTAGSHVANYRPVFPRGYYRPGELAVAFVSGVSATSFLDFKTAVRLKVVKLPTG